MPVFGWAALVADAPANHCDSNGRARWSSFAWTAENAIAEKDIIARYPAGRQASAVLPLLNLAPRRSLCYAPGEGAAA